MGRHYHPEHRIPRLAGLIVAVVVSISLGMYMLYDPGLVSRGSGPVAIAALGPSVAR